MDGSRPTIASQIAQVRDDAGGSAGRAGRRGKARRSVESFSSPASAGGASPASRRAKAVRADPLTDPEVFARRRARLGGEDNGGRKGAKSAVKASRSRHKLDGGGERRRVRSRTQSEASGKLHPMSPDERGDSAGGNGSDALATPEAHRVSPKRKKRSKGAKAKRTAEAQVLPAHACPICHGDLRIEFIREVHFTRGCPAADARKLNPTSEFQYVSELRGPGRIVVEDVHGKAELEEEERRVREAREKRERALEEKKAAVSRMNRLSKLRYQKYLASQEQDHGAQMRKLKEKEDRLINIKQRMRDADKTHRAKLAAEERKRVEAELQATRSLYRTPTAPLIDAATGQKFNTEFIARPAPKQNRVHKGALAARYSAMWAAGGDPSTRKKRRSSVIGADSLMDEEDILAEERANAAAAAMEEQQFGRRGRGMRHADAKAVAETARAASQVRATTKTLLAVRRFKKGMSKRDLANVGAAMLAGSDGDAVGGEEVEPEWKRKKRLKRERLAREREAAEPKVVSEAAKRRAERRAARAAKKKAKGGGSDAEAATTASESEAGGSTARSRSRASEAILSDDGTSVAMDDFTVSPPKQADGDKKGHPDGAAATQKGRRGRRASIEAAKRQHERRKNRLSRKSAASSRRTSAAQDSKQDDDDVSSDSEDALLNDDVSVPPSRAHGWSKKGKRTNAKVSPERSPARSPTHRRKRLAGSPQRFMGPQVPEITEDDVDISADLSSEIARLTEERGTDVLPEEITRIEAFLKEQAMRKELTKPLHDMVRRLEERHNVAVSSGAKGEAAALGKKLVEVRASIVAIEHIPGEDDAAGSPPPLPTSTASSPKRARPDSAGDGSASMRPRKLVAPYGSYRQVRSMPGSKTHSTPDSLASRSRGSRSPADGKLAPSVVRTFVQARESAAKLFTVLEEIEMEGNVQLVAEKEKAIGEIVVMRVKLQSVVKKHAAAIPDGDGDDEAAERLERAKAALELAETMEAKLTADGSRSLVIDSGDTEAVTDAHELIAAVNDVQSGINEAGKAMKRRKERQVIKRLEEERAPVKATFEDADRVIRSLRGAVNRRSSRASLASSGAESKVADVKDELDPMLLAELEMAETLMARVKTLQEKIKENPADERLTKELIALEPQVKSAAQKVAAANESAKAQLEVDSLIDESSERLREARQALASLIDANREDGAPADSAALSIEEAERSIEAADQIADVVMSTLYTEELAQEFVAAVADSELAVGAARDALEHRKAQREREGIDKLNQEVHDARETAAELSRKATGLHARANAYEEEGENAPTEQSLAIKVLLTELMEATLVVDDAATKLPEENPGKHPDRALRYVDSLKALEAKVMEVADAMDKRDLSEKRAAAVELVAAKAEATGELAVARTKLAALAAKQKKAKRPDERVGSAIDDAMAVLIQAEALEEPGTAADASEEMQQKFVSTALQVKAATLSAADAYRTWQERLRRERDERKARKAETARMARVNEASRIVADGAARLSALMVNRSELLQMALRNVELDKKEANLLQRGIDKNEWLREFDDDAVLVQPETFATALDELPAVLAEARALEDPARKRVGNNDACNVFVKAVNVLQARLTEVEAHELNVLKKQLRYYNEMSNKNREKIKQWRADTRSLVIPDRTERALHEADAGMLPVDRAARLLSEPATAAQLSERMRNYINAGKDADNFVLEAHAEMKVVYRTQAREAKAAMKAQRAHIKEMLEAEAARKDAGGEEDEASQAVKAALAALAEADEGGEGEAADDYDSEFDSSDDEAGGSASQSTPGKPPMMKRMGSFTNLSGASSRRVTSLVEQADSSSSDAQAGEEVTRTLEMQQMTVNSMLDAAEAQVSAAASELEYLEHALREAEAAPAGDEDARAVAALLEQQVQGARNTIVESRQALMAARASSLATLAALSASDRVEGKATAVEELQVLASKATAAATAATASTAATHSTVTELPRAPGGSIDWVASSKSHSAATLAQIAKDRSAARIAELTKRAEHAALSATAALSTVASNAKAGGGNPDALALASANAAVAASSKAAVLSDMVRSMNAEGEVDEATLLRLDEAVTAAHMQATAAEEIGATVERRRQMQAAAERRQSNTGGAGASGTAWIIARTAEARKRVNEARCALISSKTELKLARESLTRSLESVVDESTREQVEADIRVLDDALLAAESASEEATRRIDHVEAAAGAENDEVDDEDLRAAVASAKCAAQLAARASESVHAAHAQSSDIQAAVRSGDVDTVALLIANGSRQRKTAAAAEARSHLQRLVALEGSLSGALTVCQQLRPPSRARKRGVEDNNETVQAAATAIKQAQEAAAEASTIASDAVAAGSDTDPEVVARIAAASATAQALAEEATNAVSAVERRRALVVAQTAAEDGHRDRPARILLENHAAALEAWRIVASARGTVNGARENLVRMKDKLSAAKSSGATMGPIVTARLEQSVATAERVLEVTERHVEAAETAAMAANKAGDGESESDDEGSGVASPGAIANATALAAQAAEAAASTAHLVAESAATQASAFAALRGKGIAAVFGEKGGPSAAVAVLDGAAAAAKKSVQLRASAVTATIEEASIVENVARAVIASVADVKSNSRSVAAASDALHSDVNLLARKIAAASKASETAAAAVAAAILPDGTPSDFVRAVEAVLNAENTAAQVRALGQAIMKTTAAVESQAVAVEETRTRRSGREVAPTRATFVEVIRAVKTLAKASSSVSSGRVRLDRLRARVAAAQSVADSADEEAAAKAVREIELMQSEITVVQASVDAASAAVSQAEIAQLRVAGRPVPAIRPGELAELVQLSTAAHVLADQAVAEIFEEYDVVDAALSNSSSDKPELTLLDATSDAVTTAHVANARKSSHLSASQLRERRTLRAEGTKAMLKTRVAALRTRIASIAPGTLPEEDSEALRAAAAEAEAALLALDGPASESPQAVATVHAKLARAEALDAATARKNVALEKAAEDKAVTEAVASGASVQLVREAAQQRRAAAAAVSVTLSEQFAARKELEALKARVEAVQTDADAGTSAVLEDLEEEIQAASASLAAADESVLKAQKALQTCRESLASGGDPESAVVATTAALAAAAEAKSALEEARRSTKEPTVVLDVVEQQIGSGGDASADGGSAAKSALSLLRTRAASRKVSVAETLKARLSSLRGRLGRSKATTSAAAKTTPSEAVSGSDKAGKAAAAANAGVEAADAAATEAEEALSKISSMLEAGETVDDADLRRAAAAAERADAMSAAAEALAIASERQALDGDGDVPAAPADAMAKHASKRTMKKQMSAQNLGAMFGIPAAAMGPVGGSTAKSSPLAGKLGGKLGGSASLWSKLRTHVRKKRDPRDFMLAATKMSSALTQAANAIAAREARERRARLTALRAEVADGEGALVVAREKLNEANARNSKEGELDDEVSAAIDDATEALVSAESLHQAWAKGADEPEDISSEEAVKARLDTMQAVVDAAARSRKLVAAISDAFKVREERAADEKLDQERAAAQAALAQATKKLEALERRQLEMKEGIVIGPIGASESKGTEDVSGAAEAAGAVDGEDGTAATAPVSYIAPPLADEDDDDEMKAAATTMEADILVAKQALDDVAGLAAALADMDDGHGEDAKAHAAEFLAGVPTAVAKLNKAMEAEAAVAVARSRKRLEKLEAEVKELVEADAESGKPADAAATDLKQAIALSSGAVALRASLESTPDSKETSRAFVSQVPKVQAAVAAAKKSMAERQKREQAVKKNARVRAALADMESTERAHAEATKLVEERPELRSIPQVRAALAQADELIRPMRAMRDLVLGEDFDDGDGSGSDVEGKERRVRGVNPSVPAHVVDQLVAAVEEASRAVETVTLEAEQVKNAPTEVLTEFEAQREEAKRGLRDAFLNVKSARDVITFLRGKLMAGDLPEGTTAEEVKELLREVGDISETVDLADQAIKDGESEVNRMAAVKELRAGGGDDVEKKAHISADALASIVKAVSRARAIASVAKGAAREQKQVLDEVKVQAGAVTGMGTLTAISILKAKRARRKQMLLDSCMSRLEQINEGVAVAERVVTKMEQAEQRDSKMTEAYKVAHRAIHNATVQSESAAALLSDVAAKGAAGQETTDNDLAIIMSAVERAEMLSVAADSLVRSVERQRDLNDAQAADGAAGASRPKLPIAAVEAVSRLDNARMKFDWLTKGVEKFTGHPLEAPENAQICEAYETAKSAIREADAKHREMETANAAQAAWFFETPLDDAQQQLTLAVARAVVLVDGMGHLLDAAATGLNGGEGLSATQAMLEELGATAGGMTYQRGGLVSKKSLHKYAFMKSSDGVKGYAQRLRRIQIERFSAKFAQLVGQVKDCGTHYKHLIDDIRRANMGNLPVEVGLPLKQALQTATSALREADLGLPTPEERALRPPTLDQVKELAETVRSASIKVYLFERAMQVAVKELREQEEAEKAAAREELMNALWKGADKPVEEAESSIGESDDDVSTTYGRRSRHGSQAGSRAHSRGVSPAGTPRRGTGRHALASLSSARGTVMLRRVREASTRHLLTREEQEEEDELFRRRERASRRGSDDGSDGGHTHRSARSGRSGRSMRSRRRYRDDDHLRGRHSRRQSHRSRGRTLSRDARLPAPARSRKEVSRPGSGASSRKT